MRFHRLLLPAFALVFLSSDTAVAADKPSIAALNVGVQAGVTLLRSAIQGKVKSRRDVVQRLLWGGTSGAGFYVSKALVGDRKLTAGWILANVTASVSDNAADGRHPLARIGYSIGPVRFNVAIPRLDPGADSRVFFDVSTYETVSLIVAIKENDRMIFKGGLIAFERDTAYDSDGEGLTIGLTAGVFPGVSAAAVRFGFEETWAHEFVHAVQAVQLDVTEPVFSWATFEPPPRPDGRKRLIRIERVTFGVGHAVNALGTFWQDYGDLWYEVEAFSLAGPSRWPQPR